MMETFVSQGHEKLERSELGKQSHLLSLWGQVEWISSLNQLVGADCELDRGGELKIHLYPSIKSRSSEDQVKAVVREFGRLVFQRTSEKMRRVWAKKLGIPTKNQIDSCQDRFSQGFKSYEEFVSSFTTAVDRLVALNIGNALRANRVPPSQLVNLNLREWGPTEAYSNLRRYHSLIPLISAYSPLEVFLNYEDAFKELVISGLDKVSERSTKEALTQMVVEIASVAR